MSDESLHEIRNGTRLRRFKPGKDGPSAWSADDMNWLVDAINALLNPKIARGEKDEIQFADSNWTLMLKRSAEDGTGSAVQMFQIATPTDERPTVIAGDYIVCHTWDGITLGADDVLIAKQYHLRESITAQTIFGDFHGYTYGTGPDAYNRLRTHVVDADAQTEIVSPPWIPEQLIWAVETDTGVSVGGVAVEWLMLSDGRQWVWLQDL